MRRIGDLMKDLGFNKDAPIESQKAFVRHLIRSANATSPQNSLQIPEQRSGSGQLSFDPDILGIRETEPLPKKANSRR